jgi:hypothetical protein
MFRRDQSQIDIFLNPSWFAPKLVILSVIEVQYSNLIVTVSQTHWANSIAQKRTLQMERRTRAKRVNLICDKARRGTRRF